MITCVSAFEADGRTSRNPSEIPSENIHKTYTHVPDGADGELSGFGKDLGHGEVSKHA